MRIIHQPSLAIVTVRELKKKIYKIYKNNYFFFLILTFKKHFSILIKKKKNAVAKS